MISLVANVISPIQLTVNRWKGCQVWGGRSEGSKDHRLASDHICHLLVPHHLWLLQQCPVSWVGQPLVPHHLLLAGLPEQHDQPYLLCPGKSLLQADPQKALHQEKLLKFTQPSKQYMVPKDT